MQIFYQRIFFTPILLLFTVFLSACIGLPTKFGLMSSTKKAEQAEKTVLIINSDLSVKKYATIHEAFLSELKQLDENVKIEEADLATVFSTVPITRQIRIFQPPDIIHAIGSQAYKLANKAVTQDQNQRNQSKIVFSGIFNWRRFKQDMPNNTYGMALELPPEIQLFTVTDLFPEMKTLGVLYSDIHNQDWFKEAFSKATEIGLQLQGIVIESPNEIAEALQGLLPSVDAIWLIPDPIVLKDSQNISTIFAKASAQQKPVLSYAKSEQYDATLIMTAEIPTIGQQMALQVNNILKNNTTISDEVRYPTGSRIYLNKNLAEEYGIKVTNDSDVLAEVEIIN